MVIKILQVRDPKGSESSYEEGPNHKYAWNRMVKKIERIILPHGIGWLITEWDGGTIEYGPHSEYRLLTFKKEDNE